MVLAKPNAKNVCVCLFLPGSKEEVGSSHDAYYQCSLQPGRALQGSVVDQEKEEPKVDPPE
jgi:hypothetical protein